MTCGKTKEIVLEKQPSEKWPFAVDFTDDLEPTGEEIDLPSSTITAVDKDGDDATSTILDNQKALSTNTDRSDARTNASLQEVIKNGVRSESPYKATYRVVTDVGNVFEKDVVIKVKDR